MIRAFFDRPSVSVFALLWGSVITYWSSLDHDMVWTPVMALCTFFWLFRVWGNLRAERAK